MSSGRFVPSRAGYAEMLNLGGVQSACLAVAEQVAGTARSAGYPVVTDVRPGHLRCHARATVPLDQARADMGPDYYRALHGALPTARQALSDGASAFGG